jgi:phage terminase large subunit
MYQLNAALRDFWRVNKRYKVLHGGRASSKSHDAAGFAVYLAANFKIKVLCCRQFQNRIDESVYTLIKDKIENSDFSGEFTFTNTSISHKTTKSEFLFYGIARNLKEIKSTEGVDILWLEEGNYLTEEQWEVINPTVRKEGSQIWIIFNPDDYMDFVYQNFVVNPSEDAEVRQINWQQNPYLSDTMLKVIHDEYKRDPKKAEHIYGGMPKMGMDKSVINLSYIMAAIDAHKVLGWEPVGTKTTGFDIADDGDDLCAASTAHGNVIVHAEEWEGLEDELLKSCTKVWTHARDMGSSITYDSIGVGAHAGAKFKELNEEHKLKLGYDPFNAGGKVNDPDKIFMRLPHMNILNKDHFSNVKAQSWDEVAARFRKTHEAVTLGVKHPFDELVSLDSSKIPPHIIEKIKRELSAPRKDLDGNGRFKVESKDDMLKRGIKSPNIADSIIMALIKAKRKAAGFFDM